MEPQWNLAVSLSYNAKVVNRRMAVRTVGDRATGGEIPQDRAWQRAA
jgi:hypothetical protein